MRKTLAKDAWQVGALLSIALCMPTAASAQSPATKQATKPVAGSVEFRLPDEKLFPGVDPPPSPPWPGTDAPPKPASKAFDHLKPSPSLVEQMQIDPRKYPIVDPPPKPPKLLRE